MAEINPTRSGVMNLEGPHPEKTGKKPYNPPKLVVYGNLRELTMAKGGAKNDGGGKPATKLTGKSA